MKSCTPHQVMWGSIMTTMVVSLSVF
uniref:Uncharacterized protein n=1 Tax=Anguilla anguilla TaxID=7936 RepID=A0A0E9QRT2_ANGAN